MESETLDPSYCLLKSELGSTIDGSMHSTSWSLNAKNCDVLSTHLSSNFSSRVLVIDKHKCFVTNLCCVAAIIVAT
jgi:hypothetical protein